MRELKKNEIIYPAWLFKEEQAPIKKKIKKVYNPKTLKPIARRNIKLDDRELEKKLAKKDFYIFFYWWKFENWFQS